MFTFHVQTLWNKLFAHCLPDRPCMWCCCIQYPVVWFTLFIGLLDIFPSMHHLTCNPLMGVGFSPGLVGLVELIVGDKWLILLCIMILLLVLEWKRPPWLDKDLRRWGVEKVAPEDDAGSCGAELVGRTGDGMVGSKQNIRSVAQTHNSVAG